VAQRPEDQNKKSRENVENPHQTRSKKVVFVDEKEQRAREEKNKNKTQKQQESRIEEVEETETEVEKIAEAAEPARTKELPYVAVPPLRTAARSAVPIRKEDMSDKQTQAYKNQAPVEVAVDIEKIVESVLDLNVNVPLRSLAGVSNIVREEIKKQVTRTRKPAENLPAVGSSSNKPRKKIRLQGDALPVFMLTEQVSEDLPKGYLVADDPVLQYLREVKEGSPDDIIVAADNVPLRAIYSVINKTGQEECVLDDGSQIVSMGKSVAVGLGLTWNPNICITMESASGHYDKTLGLARNVLFRLGHLNIFLQVHILENPPYRVLLGRPFHTFTSSIVEHSIDGDAIITITDPNTKEKCTLPTYERGVPPEELARAKQLSF
jgi:hypothetical protein